MKRSILNLKNSLRLTAIACTMGIMFSSCKKESDTSGDAVTDEEVAEAVAESVSASSGGMVTQSESTAVMAGTSTLTCGASSDTAIVGQSAAGAIITYAYNLQFNRSLICTSGVPSQFNFNFTGTSSYTALRMSSSDNSNAQFAVTGLQPSSANYILNANYVRNGTQQSSVRNQRSFTSTITITSSAITISKSTKKILSGTATVQFAATASSGAGTTRGGTLTFLGNNQATLALNNGSTYTIQW